MIQVAVLGYGTVGSGVVEVIEKNKAEINKKSGEELNVKYILDLTVCALPLSSSFLASTTFKSTSGTACSFTT